MNESIKQLEELKKKLDETEDMPQEEKDAVFKCSKVSYEIRDMLQAEELAYPQMLKILSGITAGLILSCDTPLLAVASMFEDMSGYIYSCEHVAQQKKKDVKDAHNS